MTCSGEMSGLIVGGWSGTLALKSSEIIPNPNNCSLPSLPKGLNRQPSLVLTKDKNILLCGGGNNLKRCLTLKHGLWLYHSHLTDRRNYATAIAMPTGTYLFGGDLSPQTYEWLPSGSTSWKKGGKIPHPGFTTGCGVSISDTEIILIGGEYSTKAIIEFNLETMEWKSMGQLQQGRYGHSCVKFKDTIIVSGGKEPKNVGVFASTELIDVETLTSRPGPDMNRARSFHGLVEANYNEKLTVLAIGGMGFEHDWKRWNSIEVWNHDNQSWSLSSDVELSEARTSFGFVKVPTKIVC